jgi:plastocyanin
VTTLAPTVTTTAPTPQVTTPTPNQTTVAISIKNFAFNPQFITISNGTTVTWTNQDSTPHQIVNDPYMDYKIGLLFKSNSLGMGQSYSFTFTMTGTFVYHDYTYPAMTGKITVI